MDHIWHMMLIGEIEFNDDGLSLVNLRNAKPGGLSQSLPLELFGIEAEEGAANFPDPVSYEDLRSRNQDAIRRSLKCS